MKIKKIIPLFLLSASISACTYYFEIKGDFDYKDESYDIVDSLKIGRTNKAHIVLLYGQSNADGVSYNSCLEDKDFAKFEEYRDGYDNVYINFYNDHGNNSSNFEFNKCTLGCGYSKDCFGPEMGIAEQLHYSYKDEQCFIIKSAYGGTKLKDQWLDGHHDRGELYNKSMDFTLKSLKYLKKVGYEISIEGICWMQGESDALWDETTAYYRNTEAFVSLLRHDLKEYGSSVKFVDATINEDEGIWIYPKAINEAKKNFAESSTFNYLIDTNALLLTTRNEPEEAPDLAHYDSLSMVKLGQEFGKIITENKNLKN